MRARAGLSHTWREFRQKAHLDTHFRFGFRLHLPTQQTLSSIFSVVPRRLRMHLGNIVRSHLMKSPYSSSEERICPNSSEILWTDLRRKRLTCVLGCVRVCVWTCVARIDDASEMFQYIIMHMMADTWHFLYTPIWSRRVHTLTSIACSLLIQCRDQHTIHTRAHTRGIIDGMNTHFVQCVLIGGVALWFERELR